MYPGAQGRSFVDADHSVYFRVFCFGGESRAHGFRGRVLLNADWLFLRNLLRMSSPKVSFGVFCGLISADHFCIQSRSDTCTSTMPQSAIERLREARNAAATAAESRRNAAAAAVAQASATAVSGGGSVLRTPSSDSGGQSRKTTPAAATTSSKKTVRIIEAASQRPLSDAEKVDAMYMRAKSDEQWEEKALGIAHYQKEDYDRVTAGLDNMKTLFQSLPKDVWAHKEYESVREKVLPLLGDDIVREGLFQLAEMLMFIFDIYMLAGMHIFNIKGLTRMFYLLYGE